MADRPSRKLAVILHADVVSSTALVQRDESMAHDRIQNSFQRFSETIQTYGGVAQEIRGDALVAEFARASDAVIAAIAFQIENNDFNARLVDDIQPQLRIGISLGEVVIADNTVTGAGVVLAQRLEQLAEPGGVIVQGSVSETVPTRLPFEFESLGEQTLKGFDHPVRAFVVKLKSGERVPDPESNVATPEIGTDTAHQRVPLELPDKPSIAVLPFDNLSGDSEQDYFADGIVEDIITALSRLDQLFVISRNSSFTYKGRSVDVRQVSSELGVRYVLEGSIRKAGNRIRITGQLIDGDTGTHIWADRFDGALEDVFDLQDQITESVVGAIEPSLRKAEIERAKKKRPENLDAYDFYLRALPHVFANHPGANTKALELLHKAIELDPDYAPALAYAAWCYEQRLTRGWEAAQADDAAIGIDLAHRAIATNSDDANALAAAGFVIFKVGNDYDLGLTTIERALAKNPNNALVSDFAGWANALIGKPEVALSFFQRAERLSPNDPNVYTFMAGCALAHLLLGRPEEAFEAAKKSAAFSSEWDITLMILAAAATQLDRPAEARAAVEKLLAFTPNATISLTRQHFAMRSQEDLAIILDGLRAGGLPE